MQQSRAFQEITSKTQNLELRLDGKRVLRSAFQPVEKRQALLQLTSNYKANPVFNIQETYPRFSLNQEIYKTEADLSIAIKESLKNDKTFTEKDQL